MRTNLIKSSAYDGLGHSNIKKIKQREVTILGVMLPVDPGLIMIQDGTNQYEVPTLALESPPKIDFGKLLTREQKRNLRKFGVLFGPGVNRRRRLLPLNKCPLK